MAQQMANGMHGEHDGAREGPLKILITGAGIGGLTAALALRQQGHEVTVRGAQASRACQYTEGHYQLFEQSRFANETGAAIHLAPNCNGILRRLGLYAENIGGNVMLGVGSRPFSELLGFSTKSCAHRPIRSLKSTHQSVN